MRMTIRLGNEEVTMKKIAAVILCIALFGSVGWTEDDPKPVLKKGDVEKFIKTFPLLKGEFEKFGAKYDAKEGDVTVPEALKVNAEFRGILKKHGWDEAFFVKMQAIMLGYTAIVYKKEMAEVGPQIAKAIKEIEATEGMSEAMKKQMVERLKASQKMMGGGESGMETSLAEADLDLIRPKIPALKELFEHDD
jgi:hypothetical protein